jgi:hypothetical protein
MQLMQLSVADQKAHSAWMTAHPYTIPVADAPKSS